MKNVYDQNQAHFKLVSAYVIVNAQGEKVGIMNAKYPSDGAGKLFVYLHLYGSTMKRVSVSGWGYDKLGSALHSLAVTYAIEQDSETVLKPEDIEFLKELETCDSGFDSWKVYGTYRFLRAV